MPNVFASSESQHRPVMVAEMLRALQPADNEVYCDATFGAGGYTQAILRQANCKVIALDRDPTAIAAGAKLLARSDGRLQLVHSAFSDMESVLIARGHRQTDGVVLDIGVSSMQIDQAERGFSFLREGPLDMRMASDGISAADHVNTLEVADLSRVIFLLGEEPRARAIARAIERARQEQPLRTTLDLVRAVERATGPQRAKDRTHPATRTFQALRILVNNELTQLVQALAAAERLLRNGGRLVVVTFHSLEDRIVKRFFATRSGYVPSASRHQPERGQGPEPSFLLSVRKAIEAGEEELRDNPRARSAKLRFGLRTLAPAHQLDAEALGVPQLGHGLLA
jgi:16S rRNA (cytosine1402-N4)-methyltransferase